MPDGFQSLTINLTSSRLRNWPFYNKSQKKHFLDKRSLLGSNLQPPGPKADTLTIRPQYIYNVHVTVDAYLM